jgi:outer membrane biosynthesis protein TonB
MALCLKSKSGVECIDVNDFLIEMFLSVGYDCVLEEAETSDLPKVNFKRVSKDLIDIQDLVMTLKQKVQDQQYPSDENLAPEEEAPPAAPEDTTPEPPAEEPAPEAAPEKAPEAAPEETPEQAPEPQAQDDVVNDIADLENMVADIAAELGMDDTEKEDE